MAAIRHHTCKLRREERNGTDPLCALYTRDRFSLKILCCFYLLLSTGTAIVCVCVCVCVRERERVCERMCQGGGGLSLPSSLKASERAPLSDQQSPSRTLLYTSIPLQNQTPENLSETLKIRVG